MDRGKSTSTSSSPSPAAGSDVKRNGINNTDAAGVLSISACASKMASAVAQVISLGEKESRKSADQVFNSHMMSACETLDLAKTNLFVTAQQFEIDPNSPGTRQALCQAAKDVLQAVLKVLLVVDDEKVSRIVALIGQVQNKLGAVGVVDRTNQLVPSFRELTDSILKLKAHMDMRREDLCSEACREQLAVSFGVLRKCVPSLSMAMQTVLKYKSNLTAEASRDLVLQQMYTALKEMQQLLQTGVCGTAGKDEQRQGSFVDQIDQVMEFLSDGQRSQLSVDFESTLVSAVGHSLSVSHFYGGSLRELIISSCHRILQAKFRLLDLNKARVATPNVPNIEDEYNAVCETILDEVCDLEKHVNMTLLHLIVDTFIESSSPLDKLVKAALGYKSKNRPFTETHEALMIDFTEHSDRVCNVAMLVAASSTDVTCVSDIRSSVHGLESIDPDIIPAVVTVANEPSRMAGVRHLRLLVKRWQIEMDTVVRAVDKMVDPHVFLDVTEQRISEEVAGMNLANIALLERHAVKPRVHRSLCLADRACQLGTRLVESHADPIYRNGLMVFVRKVSEATALARASANDVLANAPSSQLVDTMARRLNLLGDSVADLRQGLNARHHPHILSRERDWKPGDKRQTRGRGRPSNRTVPSQGDDDDVDDNDGHPKDPKANRFQQQHQRQSAVSSSASIKSQVSVSKLTEAMEGKLGVKDGGDKQVTSTAQESREDDNDTKRPASRSSGVGNVYSWPAHPQMDEKTANSAVPTEMTKAVLEEENEKASSIQLLVNRLLTAATEGDRISTDNLTSDLLGWTNHIVDAGDMLMTHCSDIYKREELREILRLVDELAPEVIQRSKFMVSGDKEGLSELFAQANEWGKKTERARVIVDVAADRWLLLADTLGQAMQAGDEEEVKTVLSSITSAQQEIGRLLLKTRFLSGKMVEGGVETVEFLGECLKDVENLAITIRTSVDVTAVSVTRTASDKWQLVQVCRDWSVMMTCVVAQLDKICSRMEELGKRKFPCLRRKQGVRDSRLSDTLEGETNLLLELIDCVVSGDLTLKAKSEDLVADISVALQDIVGVVSQTVVSSKVPQHVLFSRLRIGLARCRWLEKALEIRDLIYHATFDLSGCVRHTLHAILDFRETGPTPDALQKEEHRLSNAFLEMGSSLKQKSLAAVQLSSDLPRRAAVRSVLDTISELTSKIHAKVKDPELTEEDVAYYAEHWGARVKKLTGQLRKLEGIRQGTVNEIEKLTKFKNVAGGLKGEGLMTRARQEPQLRGAPGRMDSADSNALSLSQSSYAGLQNQNASPMGKSVSLLLKGAQFVDSKFGHWDWADVEGNPEGHGEEEATPESPWSIAHHARAMARLSSNMALFTKGQGPFEDSEEVVGAAVAMTRHSSALEELARTLASLVLDSRGASDLEASTTRMNSMTSQLHIIATALHNSARSFEGDRMLVRNAYNLLSSVKDLLARMESAAFLEIREPTVVDDKIKSILSLLSRVSRENDRYMEAERSTTDIDELGLRRVEQHNPPTLTSLVRP